MKRVPNIISGARLLLTLTLPFISLIKQEPFMQALFVTVFILCGTSDAIDGKIARKYHVESEFGAKLDNLADVMLALMSLISLLVVMNIRGVVAKPSWGQFICVIAVAVIKIVNLVITKLKFKQWNILKTVFNKLTGFAIFAAIPFFVILKEYNIIVLAALAVVMSLSAREETVILLTSKTYDVNQKTLFEKHLKKKG